VQSLRAGLQLGTGRATVRVRRKELAMTDRTRIARQFIEAIPHSRALGMHLDLLGEGVAVVSTPMHKHL
jgi:hypothetical protein